MANVKIADLPEIASLASSDVLPSVDVGANTTYKITVQSLANSLTQVSSSISASFSTNSATASFVTSSKVQGPLGANSVLSSSFSVTSSYVLQAVSASFATTASFVTLAQTASFVTASNVRGPFGANSVLSASFAVSASWAPSAGGVPGGNTTELQYNNAGAFAGVSVAKFDGTTLRATGSFSGSLTGALTGTASWAQNSSTASFLNSLNQNLAITGSLVVSGANGAGVFSQGATLVDYIDGISNSGSYMVWRAPFSCSVVALYGYYIGGSAPQVNALRSGSSGIGLVTGSNLTLSSQNTWVAALPNFQNRDFNAGDGLTVVMSGSANNQLAVQVDFIRKF